MVDVFYSVDMVRLKTKVPKDYMTNYSKRYLDTDPGVKYWVKFDYKSYRHNWQVRENHPMNEDKFSLGTYSYWLGYMHNAEDTKSDSSSLVLEFNPNKCPIDGLFEIILKKFFASGDTIIVSVDVAMDFEVNITNILVDKFRKKKMKIIYGGQGEDDLTYYMGEGDGRIKLYNKAREMGVNGDLTRYEVSKKISKSINDVIDPGFEFKANIPPLGYMNSIPTDKTLQGLLFALKNGYPMDSLTRRNKENIRKYMTDNTELEFDNKRISRAIRSYFTGYKNILQF